MYEVEIWLEQSIAPLSRMGARLCAPPLFSPGEEDAAQRSIDVLLHDAFWNDAQSDSIRARLPKVPDIGQSLLAAQAGAIDIVDLARLVAFFDFFFGVLSDWQSTVATVFGLQIDAATREQLEEIYDAVRRGQTNEGYALHDGLDNGLAAQRRDLRVVQSELATWGTVALAELRAIGVAAAHQPEFLVLRSAQSLLASDAVRDRVRIIRETPDFVVCALRYDESALSLLAREQAIEQTIEAMEEALLTVYAEALLRSTAALELASRWVAALDVALARRAFVVRYRLRRAQVVTNDHFSCQDAVYLPLHEEIGTRYTPLNIGFDNIAILSGANMGGKTCALQTVALLAACVRRGLPVPARAARVALFTRILCLGEAVTTSASDGLSAFGREMASVREVLAIDNARCLVVLDEVGRTTTPREGRALLIAALRGLRTRGACAIAATHLDDIAEALDAAHFRLVGISADSIVASEGSQAQLLRSLEDAFDRRFLAVEPGRREPSQALQVARALGLPDDVLTYAQEELQR